jgi:hypothetical protein
LLTINTPVVCVLATREVRNENSGYAKLQNMETILSAPGDGLQLFQA